ncbi:unnamed protein product [Effrenium voratum]|uniref:GAR domain-containing protein n=1 Tax=Effrenium voratum TaxID=2562239 RepID=A0AA36JK24_9DINO|nr:unnamed protein product [Effrenium voratum]
MQKNPPYEKWKASELRLPVAQQALGFLSAELKEALARGLSCEPPKPEPGEPGEPPGEPPAAARHRFDVALNTLLKSGADEPTAQALLGAIRRQLPALKAPQAATLLRRSFRHKVNSLRCLGRRVLEQLLGIQVEPSERARKRRKTGREEEKGGRRLRAELDALKSLLDEGLQQREEAERSQSALISKVEQLSQCKLHAEQQMREAQAESQWLRKELALARRQDLENCGEPDANNVHPPPTKPPLRSSSWSPPPQRGEKAAATAPPSPKHSARNRGACSSEPRSFAMARSASLKPPPEPQLTDEVDEMWRSLLQRFPQHPHWCLVKEKRCVYRMGSQTGKKILCRVTHGGLQVRVGGGWMAALSFLERYGPMNMGRYAEDHQFNCASVDVPASMERLLVPTKSWAQRIGISKSPDIREQRRMQDKTVEELPEEARSFGAKMAWSNVAKPDEEVDECEKAHSALQPLPWPGDTRSAIER